ncbi:MAG: dimethylsulfonioproprionate lyase family protein [Geminicoccaceae bacterium]
MTATTVEPWLRPLLNEIHDYLRRLEGSGLDEVRRLSVQARKVVPIRPRPLQLAAELEGALAAVRTGGEPALAKAIEGAAPFLSWITYDAYPREEIGDAFADGHAFASLIGPEAPVAAEDFDLGLFLIRSNLLYRDHHHAAPELYAPLTGPHGWRFRPNDSIEWRPAHRPVWNEPWQPHATLVGDVPFLCIFAWTKDIGQVAKVLPADDWADLERLRPGSGR